MTKEALYKKLELEASRGAALSDLAAEIDKTGQLLTDFERGQAWLYAWTWVNHHESRLLRSARNGNRDEGPRVE